VNRALNVVHVCDHLGWTGSRMHGVKRLFAWMIPRFDRERFTVSLISLRKRDSSDDTLDELGIDVTYMHRSKFDPATLPALLKELDRRQADVVHLHGYGASTFGRLAAAIRHIPVVVHEHANLTDTPWFQKVADRLLVPATDIAIAVSQSTDEFTTRARLIPAERTKVVYLGVPLEEFSRVRSGEEVSAARQALGIPPDAFAVGTITRLMPSKGNEYLVDAARRVIDALPRARIYIVGEGELQPALEARAAALGLGDRLVFSGFRRDVAAALSALDLVVFPSLWEGTPLTVLEALAMGKAIVATDADGLKDVLTDGHDSRMVARRDAAALAEAIVGLAQDPGECARLGANARRTGEQYDIDRFVKKMERLYVLLHETSRATRRRGVLDADLGFLASGPAVRGGDAGTASATGPP
jgi:glycosyltransferase involved in cell wall biosynthesis